MNLHPDALRESFLKFHTHTTRHKKNRDKALVPYHNPDNGFQGRDRFYYTPTEHTWDDAKKRVIPTPNCDWKFVLYNTPIVTIHQNRTATINTGGYTAPLTFDHVRYILGCRFQRWKPNKWMDSAVHVYYGDEHCKFEEGMVWDIELQKPTDPTPNIITIPDYSNSEVKEIRKNLTAVKKRYLPLALLHATSDHVKVDPFKDLDGRTKEIYYEQLIQETDADPQTYVSLVGWKGLRRWNWGYNPVAKLNSTLQRIKDEKYKEFLMEKVQ